MFSPRLLIPGVVLLTLLVAGLGGARPSSGATPDTATPAGPPGSPARYVVKPGDTLWAIAEARYDGDPREGVWRLEKRNKLTGVMLEPGMVLVLP